MTHFLPAWFLAHQIKTLELERANIQARIKNEQAHPGDQDRLSAIESELEKLTGQWKQTTSDWL